MSDDFLFRDLDDPTPPAPSSDMLHAAASRGRSIRHRRHAVVALAAASVAAITIGVTTAVSASHGDTGSRDNISVPADGTSPTPQHGKSSAPRQPSAAGNPVYAAAGHHPAAPRSGTKPVTNSCAGSNDAPPTSPPTEVTASPAPTDIPTATPSPPAVPTGSPSPSATAQPATCTSPSPTPNPADSPSAEPTGTPSPDPNPS